MYGIAIVGLQPFLFPDGSGGNANISVAIKTRSKIVSDALHVN